MSIYDTPGFNKLRKQWYDKLKRKGFKDCETLDGYLNDNTHRRYSGNNAGDVEGRKAYYELAQDWLIRNKSWKSSKHKKAWRLHCEGLITKDISSRVGLTFWQVWLSIDDNRKKMKAKARI